MYVLFVCNCLLVDLFVCVLIFVLVVNVCCVLFVWAWCYESGGTSSVVSVVVVASDNLETSIDFNGRLHL